MGSIANKLDYTADAKESIRQAIIDKGASCPSDLPLGEYPKSILAIPSGGGSTNIHIYSTEEQQVGQWINGEPVYEIVATSRPKKSTLLSQSSAIDGYSVYTYLKNNFDFEVFLENMGTAVSTGTIPNSNRKLYIAANQASKRDFEGVCYIDLDTHEIVAATNVQEFIYEKYLGTYWTANGIKTNQSYTYNYTESTNTYAYYWNNGSGSYGTITIVDNNDGTISMNNSWSTNGSIALIKI